MRHRSIPPRDGDYASDRAERQGAGESVRDAKRPFSVRDLVHNRIRRGMDPEMADAMAKLIGADPSKGEGADSQE